jgi:hypothetical protein
MVFVLSGHSASAAMDYLNKKGPRAIAEQESQRLEKEVEWAYIHEPLPSLCAMFSEPLAANLWKMVYKATKCCVERRLAEYVVYQNCVKGVAPGRSQLAQEALRTIPAEAPPTVCEKLRFELNGRARSVRKWLASFRKRWGARIGKLAVHEQIPSDQVAAKAG